MTDDIAHRYLQEGDPTGWFDEVYQQMGMDAPWSKHEPHPLLREWLPDSEGRRGLVVGCGLGDDAELLARRGWQVTAFDVSEKAIELARQRFPDSPVEYRVADLFEPPSEWERAFDLVVEIITVQALPPDLQEDAIRQVAGFVRGQAFVVTLARQPEYRPAGPPWPLSRASLDAFEAAGLHEAARDETLLNEEPRIWRINAIYTR